MRRPLRLLTAVPVCDGHDSAVNTLNLEFIRHGIEVVYLGFHRSASDIARAAVQEDVAAVGISSYNGGHVEFFREVRGELNRRGGGHIGLFGGGGGTISQLDAGRMRRQGTDEIFFAGAPLSEIVRFTIETYGKMRPRSPENHADARLSYRLTADQGDGSRSAKASTSHSNSQVIGITGPGGAGKTTLIDELVLRWLRSSLDARLAVLSHDPSLIGEGALLGDRAMMIHSQNDRVFMRSLAARGNASGLSPETRRCISVLQRQDFRQILVETVGTGQEAQPFRVGPFAKKVLVMHPEYGSRLQLQKMVMLDSADIVVLNKSDQPRAKAAAVEIGARLSENGRGQKLVMTEARHHLDPGVDELFRLLAETKR